MDTTRDIVRASSKNNILGVARDGIAAIVGHARRFDRLYVGIRNVATRSRPLAHDASAPVNVTAEEFLVSWRFRARGSAASLYPVWRLYLDGLVHVGVAWVARLGAERDCDQAVRII